MVGLNCGGDETACSDNVQRLSMWCKQNNLILNTFKSKELMIDYWKKKTDTHPVNINGDRVRRVSDFKFLSLHLDDDLESEHH